MRNEFPLEDLVELPDFYAPVLSPDGDRVAFFYDVTGRIELYVQDVETGDREQISDGNVPRNVRVPPAWRPDGEAFLLHVDEGGDEQYDVVEMDLDGERTPLVEQEGQCVVQDVRPGEFLFTSTGGGQMNLYRYDRASEAVTTLTAYADPVRTAVYGPDGDHVAYVTNETDDPQNRDVYVAGLAALADGPVGGDAAEHSAGDGAAAGPDPLDVGEVGSQSTVADWTGQRLLLTDDATGIERAGVYDLEADSVAWYSDGDYEEPARRFTPDGDAIALRRRDCAMVPVHYESPDDGGTEFALPEGVVHTAGFGYQGAFDADGRVLTTAQTADNRERMLVYDLDEDTAETLLDAEYGDFDPDGFTDAEFVTYDSFDGLEIEGLLWDSGERPSPALVMVHGGPQAQTTRGFNPFVQYLVAQGYSVFAPNYRGSIGRGREFRDLLVGDWGGGEQRDVVEAGRWLKAREWVNEDRVGVFGGSYGGYSTYCQLTMYPDEWATGVAIVGMTDLNALYEESMPHFKSALEEQVGDPDEHPERYEQRSPVTHVEDMTQPICIIHGVNDPRCPISQARLFRDALEDRGWAEGEDGDFEYYELGEEGHGSTDTEQRIRQYGLLGEYVERRL